MKKNNTKTKVIEMKNTLKTAIKNQFIGRSIDILLIIFMIIIGLASVKYVSAGDTYVYEIPWAEEKVAINGNVIGQTIIIDEKTDWNNYSYAVFLYVENEIEKGYLEAALSQNGEILQTISIKPAYLKTGWYVCQKFNYSKLESGYATIEFRGLDLDQTVYLGTRSNTYNIPNYTINDIDAGATLVQRYHINYNNKEYKLRLIAFVLFILISIAGTYLVLKKEDNIKYSNIIRLILILSHMCLVFIYNSSLYMSPTWAEAVINFMYSGMNFRFRDNLLLTDAGYLPLFQRLLALFFIRILGLPAYSALFAMQISAYIITGIILSFFAKNQFREYFDLKYRYLISLLFMILIISKDTGAFINFIGYGILIIFFYYLIDSSKWSRFEYICLCGFTFLACLSKGYYVTILPFMVVCFLLFHKNYSRKDMIFSALNAAAAVFQLIYYLVNGADWVDRREMANLEFYHLKLVLQSLIDVPNSILNIFNKNIEFFNGLSILIFISFWLVILVIFIKEIVLKLVSKKNISRNTQLFFMSIIYILIQSLFLRITVYGVSTANIFSDDFWNFTNRGIESRYQVSIFVAVVFGFIVFTKQLREHNLRNVQMTAVAGLMLCAVISNPRLQLKGLGNDNFVAARTEFSDLIAEVDLFKKYESAESIMIPIQPNFWKPAAFKKNADVYCFGKDINQWQASCIDSQEPYTGNIKINNYKNVNKSCYIYQIFIKKQNLINRQNYQIVLIDDTGNTILRQSQDNSNYQRTTSFTFDSPVKDVAEILILDGQGNRVYIENSLYVVTKKGDSFIAE